MLGELAELGLMVAKELAVRLRECEDPEQATTLANAFQKASRVVRLTLALDFKLDRDAARDARAEAREAAEAEKARADAEAEAARLAARAVQAAPQAPNPIRVRKDRVQNLMNRLLWSEAEGDEHEYEVLFDDLSARLDEAARSPDFETLPLEALARRVIADMGLSGELTLSLCEAPDPPPLVPPSPSPREGDGARRPPDG